MAHAPGGILAQYPKPDQIIDQGTAYQIKWSQYPEESMNMTNQMSATFAASIYVMAYPAKLKLITPEPPIEPPTPPIEPTPIPVPPSSDLLRAIAKAQVESLEAQLVIWRRLS